MQKNTEFPQLSSNEFTKIKDIYPEEITKFAFNLTRKTPNDLQILSNEFLYLLISIKNDLFISDDTIEIKKYIDYFILLNKLIIYTRDIFVGKGERDLTYMMIYILYTQFPILAINALKKIEEVHSYPYGSWKDIKYFCNYVRENSHLKEKDPFIDTCIYILNEHLIEDLSIISQNQQNQQNQHKISFVGKWIPREKSKKFGWLFNKCAIQWSQIIYPEYYYMVNNKEPSLKFQNKIKREYRKNLSLLNNYLNTVQIKQCQNKWSEIRFNNVSVNTLQKQWNVFLNQDTYGYIRKQNEDRNICRENIINYMFYKKKEDICKISSSFQMEDLIKDIENAQTLEYMERINMNWDKVKSSILQNIENIIPILDLTTLNYRNALSISIMLSEISKLKNKIIVYDQIATWINLSNTSSLLEKIEIIQNIKNSKPIIEISNLFSSLELLMISIINTNLTEEDVGNLVLCIISDFSIPLHDLQLHIQYFFYKYGYTKIPHIVYWNVSLNIKTTFPCSAFTPRTLMISGTSSSCLHFLNDPLWREYTPYTYLCSVLNQDRYSEIDNDLLELIKGTN